MPHTTPYGTTHDSGDFRMVLDTALRWMDCAGFAARRAEAAQRGRRRGIGLSYYPEATDGDPTERAEIRFAADGNVDVYVGTQSTGQGHETAYVQLASNRLGIDADRIRIRQGDTDIIPVGSGTGGARSLYSEGQAILLTADSVIGKGRQAAAEMLEASPADIAFADGRFFIVGTDRGVDILAFAATQRQKAAAGQPATTLDAAEVASIDRHTFPNGCHMAEVEVDPDTGMVEIVRYRVCDNFGKATNSLIVRGQVHGGVAQGFGQAVQEHAAYDASSGQLLSGSFMDYLWHPAQRHNAARVRQMLQLRAPPKADPPPELVLPSLEQFGAEPMPPIEPRICPHCHQARLVFIRTPPGSPVTNATDSSNPAPDDPADRLENATTGRDIAVVPRRPRRPGRNNQSRHRAFPLKSP